MLQPETWKTIGEYSGKLWTAVGPLIGVLIGAWIGRAWDRKKWAQENRKEECRELLASIMHARIVILDVGDVHTGSEAYKALMDSLKTFDARIFIAEDIEKTKLFDTWQNLVHDFVSKRGLTHKLSATEWTGCDSQSLASWCRNAEDCAVLFDHLQTRIASLRFRQVFGMDHQPLPIARLDRLSVPKTPSNLKTQSLRPFVRPWPCP